jgi:hypothetical protein
LLDAARIPWRHEGGPKRRVTALDDGTGVNVMATENNATGSALPMIGAVVLAAVWTAYTIFFLIEFFTGA